MWARDRSFSCQKDSKKMQKNEIVGLKRRDFKWPLARKMRVGDCVSQETLLRVFQEAVCV